MEASNMPRKRLVAFVIVLVIVIFAILLGLMLGARQSNAPEAYSKPSDEVMAVVTKYIQSREDSIGADQSSPTSWLKDVKAITTASWFASLQPVSNPSTGGVPYSYTYAHQKSYVVKANLNTCYWEGLSGGPTKNGGTVLCALSDTTIDMDSGKVIPASSLQIGWTRTGKQLAPRLELVMQNHQWLVNGDSSGLGH